MQIRSALMSLLLIAVGTLLRDRVAWSDESVPQTTRRLVLETAESGFRWKIDEVQIPALAPGQVLVRVRAAGLNRTDVELLDPKNIGKAGQVVGSDAAGEIVRVGADVKGLRIGDRVTTLFFRDWMDGPPSEKNTAAVHGYTIDGVICEYLAISADAVVPAPPDLTFEEAATLPTSGLTAWMAVIGHGAVQKEDTVVVQGTGGVSTYALQFARAAGARVIVTSSSDDKLRTARELGASAGINYRATPAWSARVLELTDGRGADLIVDVGGKASLPESAKGLAYGGTLAVVGGVTGYDGQVPALPLILKSAQARGLYGGSRADFERMSRFVSERRIRPVIARVFEFRDFQAAFDYMQSGAANGKVVLRF